MKPLILSLILCLFITSCGTRSSSNTSEIEKYATKGNVEVVIFAAPWCGPCHKLAKQLNDAYNNSFDTNLMARIQNTAYITTGLDSGSPPEEEDLAGERTKLGPRFTVKPDANWVVYKTYFDGAVFKIPAVVVKPEGKPDKVFPNSQELSAQQLATFIKAILR